MIVRLAISLFALSAALAGCDGGGSTDAGRADVPGLDTAGADVPASDAPRLDTPGADVPASGTCTVTPRTGEGTYYAADGTGNCGFAASTDFVAAMNTPDWADSNVCGTCAEVTGPSGTVTMRIVDRCPECPSGDLDLSMAAFAEIAEISAGRVPISWHEVPCDVSSNVIFHVDEGANPYYLAVNVRNHRHRLVSVERRTAGGSYVPFVRQSYNVWVESPVEGAPVDEMHLRATDVYGHVIEADVLVTPGLDADGGAQFPDCR